MIDQKNQAWFSALHRLISLFAESSKQAYND
jgi:hypothetical protein